MNYNTNEIKQYKGYAHRGYKGHNKNSFFELNHLIAFLPAFPNY